MRFIDDAARGTHRADADQLSRNIGPTATTVTTILAEDTVVGPRPLSTQDDTPVAMFANPFREGAEEFCLLDADGRLTHVYRTPGGDGWSQESLEDLVSELVSDLVVAVHWDGSVCLFVATGAGALLAFKLWPDSGWRSIPVNAAGKWSSLSVHYLPDRPATASVIGLDETRKDLQVLMPRFATFDDSSTWISVFGGTLPTALPASYAVGLEGSGILRVYAYDGTTIVLHTYWGGWLTDEYVPGAAGARALVGVWNAPGGVGCVFIGSDGLLRVYAMAGADDFLLSLDTPELFTRATLWQDEQGMLHIYAKSSTYAGVLQVMHQDGWTTESPIQPAFVTAPKDEKEKVVALPVGSGVGDWYVDPMPDPYPSQLLFPSDSAQPVKVASQDVTTSWWTQESVLLTARDGTPSLQLRHICDVTVRDGFGAPMPDWPVQLSAASTVEVDLRGRRLRLGPSAVAHVRTDEAGRLSLRIAADGLTVPTIQVRAKGMAEGGSAGSSSGLLDFLAGTSVLAAHPQQLTADLLLNATVDDGWLVPGWPHQPGSPTTLPQPQEVVDTLTSVFAQVRGGAEEVGFVVQRTDAGGPAYRRLAPDETPREALGLGEASDLSPWLRDLWRGVRDGSLDVVGYASDGRGSFTINCLAPGGVPIHAECALRSDTDAALAVEAVFQQLGAGVDRLVAWLAWRIPFTEIWHTATALTAALDQPPAALTSTAKHYQSTLKPGWIVGNAAGAERGLAAVREMVHGLRVGGLLAGVETPQAQTPTPIYQPDTLITPQSTLVHDLLVAIPGAPHAGEPGTAEADWDALWTALTASPPGKDFDAAFVKAQAALAALWDPDDATAAEGTPVASLLDIVSDALPQMLALADAACPKALTALTSMSDELTTGLAEPLVVRGLNDFYQWFQQRAGVQPDDEVALTRGGLGALYAAFPLTSAYLTVVGSEPFPGATFPSYTIPWGPKQEPQIDQRDLFLAVQVLGGAAQLAYTGIDLYLDFRDSSQWVNYGIAVFELVGFSLCGLPYFWDTPADSDTGDEIAWAQWALWTLLYSMDFVTSFLPDNSSLVTRYAGGEGNRLLFIVGALQIVLAGVAYDVSPKNDLDRQWLYGAVAASLSTLTAPVRLLLGKERTKWVAVALALKAVTDLVADFAGGWVYLTLPLSQLQYPVAIKPTKLPAATTGKKYESSLEATMGYPPYTWAIDGKLPPGITFDGDAGTFGGTPADGSAGTYPLVISVTDDYAPPSTATVNASLVVG